MLGVANKMATVLTNALLWDQRASLVGIGFLSLCLVRGLLVAADGF